jgi:sugar O-acyltransferase (sialic acid O-acetyltransferase NeuD family)
MKPLVIWGQGQIARTVAWYAQAWGCGEVAAFVVDREYLPAEAPAGPPVVAADEMAGRFPPSRYAAFVAVGYHELNALRARLVTRLQGLDYEMASVINPAARPLVTAGINCLVIPGETHLEPFVTLGDDVFVWNAVSLSHYVVVGDHTWLSNGTMVGGNATIGAGCMVGLNVTVNNRVAVGAGCLLGSGALVTRDVPDGEAVLPAGTPVTPGGARRIQALLR